MDAIIIVGIISAVVSILALLGNIYIARQNIKSSERIIKLESAEAFQKERYKTFIEFEKQTELFRIQCWNIKWRLDDHLDSSTNLSVADTETSLKNFYEHGERFVIQWTSIKPELPIELEGYVRKIRHDCNNKMRVIYFGYGSLLKQLSSENAQNTELISLNMKELTNHANRISHDINELLGDLDELINISKSCRSTLN